MNSWQYSMVWFYSILSHVLEACVSIPARMEFAIYYRLAKFTQIGVNSLVLAERGAYPRRVPSDQGVSQGCSCVWSKLKVSRNKFGGLHAITLGFQALGRLRRTWSTPKPSLSSAPSLSQTGASQRLQKHTSTNSWSTLESFRTSNTRQTWNAKLASSSNLKLTSYGFVAREADGDEGEEATAAKAAAAAAAAAAEAVVVAAAARSNRPNYSLDWSVFCTEVKRIVYHYGLQLRALQIEAAYATA